MAHETPTLTAEPRPRTGTRYSRRLRATGRLPAIVYGHQQEPVAVSVDEKETLSILHRGVHLINLDIAGDASQTCLVKELQFGFLGDNVIHVDFTRVDLDEEVTVNVHLHFVGEPESAKQPGAVISTDMTDLEIICKASEIPDEIKVDISKMEDSIAVGELILPEGVRTAVDPGTSVVHIDFVEEMEEAEEVEVVAEVEPEVITEAKPEEEEEPAEPGEKGKKES